MSKYSAIIAEARKPENQKAENLAIQPNDKPDLLKAGKPENQKRTKPAKSESKKAVLPESQKARKPESQPIKNTSDEEGNLSIKVSLRRRRHWAAQAKMQGTTLTAEIIAALSERFGEPD